jgi:heptosyltransferase-1
MKVLIVKLTSMGDVLHALPALSDLHSQYPNLEVDWVVEEHFCDIPSWHPAVKRVIPVATRRWRKKSKSGNRIKEVRQFLSALRVQKYDYVIDAQGLIKSALVSYLAKGKRVGFSGRSIKESPAAWFYQLKQDIPREMHAITRLRELFAKSFHYNLNNLPLEYNLGIDKNSDQDEPFLMFFHATTWASKHISTDYWRELAEYAGQSGFKVKLPWGNETERMRAVGIAESHEHVSVLPKSSLTELANLTARAQGAIAVDTGLGHLAAALGVPCLSIYGSTNSELTGTRGLYQGQLAMQYECSPCLRKECDRISTTEGIIPCYQSISSLEIWQLFVKLISH